MKKAIFIIAAIAICCLSVVAAPYEIWPSASYAVYTNTYSYATNTTNWSAVTLTNVVGLERSVNHTFQEFNTQTGIGTNSVYLDSTLDAANWYNFSTNTFTASGNAQVQLTGKWIQIRERISIASTNSTTTVNYTSQ